MHRCCSARMQLHSLLRYSKTPTAVGKSCQAKCLIFAISAPSQIWCSSNSQASSKLHRALFGLHPNRWQLLCENAAREPCNKMVAWACHAALENRYHLYCMINGFVRSIRFSSSCLCNAHKETIRTNVHGQLSMMQMKR